MTLTEASKLTGVSVGTLRHLALHRALPGVVRGEKGQLRMRAAALPTFEKVEAALERRVVASIADVRKHLERVRVEMEAVGNDLSELEDDPGGPIGVDLETFDTLSTMEDSTLRGALSRMTRATVLLLSERRALDDLRLRY